MRTLALSERRHLYAPAYVVQTAYILVVAVMKTHSLALSKLVVAGVAASLGWSTSALSADSSKTLPSWLLIRTTSWSRHRGRRRRIEHTQQSVEPCASASSLSQHVAMSSTSDDPTRSVSSAKPCRPASGVGRCRQSSLRTRKVQTVANSSR